MDGSQENIIRQRAASKDAQSSRMYDGLREDFISGLSGFYSNNVMPPRASINMRRALTEHKKRLDSKGITYKETYTPVEEPRVQEIKVVSYAFPTVDVSEHFDIATEMTDGKCGIRCNDEADDILHLQVIDRRDKEEGEEDEGEIMLVCPNCGSQADADTLAGGCPKCGTRFQIDDLYPCVNTYYHRPYPLPSQSDDATIKRFKLAIKIGGALGVCMGVYSAVSEFLSAGRILQSITIGAGNFVFGSMILILVVYAILTVIFAVRSVGGGVKVLADTLDMKGMYSAKVRTEAAVRKYDLAFSYEVFEGKILSAIRTIAYSDDRSNCSLYIGDDDLSFMDELVDIRYRGASKFESSSLVGDYLHISMTVYLDNIYYTGDYFTQKRENFTVNLVRHKSVKTSPTFTAYSLNCPTCGASYDAVVSCKCPFCGAEGDLSGFDWSINRITRVDAG